MLRLVFVSTFSVPVRGHARVMNECLPTHCWYARKVNLSIRDEAVCCMAGRHRICCHELNRIIILPRPR
jgi:hypothetical protein